MKSITNFQTDLLRTFVSVIELGGHTKAGIALGRSQPAISLQIGRLEELAGASLLKKEGRTILPTQEGEKLLTFAREIVRINDEAAHYFRRGVLSGVLRIGLPTDYAMAFLQETLTSFVRKHPEVDLEVHCDVSRSLHQQMRADELDIIVATMPTPQMPYLSRSWIESPVWAAATTFKFDADKPIPLAAHPEGCDYRARMIQALDSIGRRWRVVYTGPGVSGLQTAVLNGLCISALTQPTLLEGMHIISEQDGMPPLESIRVGLFYKHPKLSAAGINLVSDVVGRLDSFGAVPPLNSSILPA